MSFIIDVETVAFDGAAALVEPVSAPSNYKDPQKIAEYIANAEKAQIEKAALYPWTARIVCLCVIDVRTGAEFSFPCLTMEDERSACVTFWHMAQNGDERFVRPILGFNHRTFDLPVLLARSLLLGVDAPALNLDRYRTPHIDLLDKLTWYGAVPARSLKWFAQRFGIPCEDTVSGADIAGLMAAGQWETVQAHCLSDVRLTYALAQKLGTVRALTGAA